MSYKLINANNITFNSDGFITAKNIDKMPCIYADLPNGMDGEHYVLEQQSTLDKIRAEIERKANSGQWSEPVIYGMKKSIALIDKHKAESEL